MTPPRINRAIQFTTVSSIGDVRHIHALQAANLATGVTSEAIATQGFVTVRHELSVLQRMNAVAPAIVAKDDGRVVAYALVMPRECAAEVPMLRPLFETLDALSWRGLSLRVNPRRFVIGQICVAEAYRGSGNFDGLYRATSEIDGDRYDFTITEGAARNTR